MTGSVLRQRILVLALHLVALGVLALQVFVRRFPPTDTAIPEPGTPEALWWGLWPITYLPAWAFFGGAAMVIAVSVYAWRTEFAGAHPVTVGEAQNPHMTRILTAVTLLLVVAFFAFPIVHTRWGDAYILSKSIAWPDADLRLTRSWQAPLDVYLHSSLWLALRPYFVWEDATPVYRILSPLAGALYLAALLALSRNRAFAPAWLSYGLLATLGLLQLFFGYIENYSFATALVLLYMVLGVRVTQRARPVWTAAAALALANAFHPSTLVLGPSLLWLAWLDLHHRREAGNNPLARDVIHTGAQLVAPLVLIYGFTWIIMETGGHGLTALFTTDKPGGGDARWLVPLRETTTQWERYTLFSWPHLRDFLNEQLLIAPVVLPSLLVVATFRFFTREHRADAETAHSAPPYAAPNRSIAVFLAIAFAFYLLFTWLWNPDYGGQRDWDLFSLVAIPSALLLVYSLARSVTPADRLVRAAAPLIAVQALHTAAWIYQNTLPWSWP